jgi:ATP-dependent Clp protease protease subunit
MQQQDVVREIIISEEITSDLSKEVITRINEINYFDDQMTATLKDYEPEPIEIYINSPGGSVYDGFAIIGAMEMSDTPIITHGMGMVGSMALGIFVKGDVRVAHRYTRFLYHSVSYGINGYIKDHEDYHKEVQILQSMYNDLFKETKLAPELMDEIKNTKINHIFSGKEAVELGIADIVTKKPERKIKVVEQEEDAQETED